MAARRSIRSRAESGGVLGLQNRRERMLEPLTADVGAGEPLQGAEPPTAVLERLSERAFQKLVVDGLRQRGYLVFVFPIMKLTQAGWPDVVAIHPANPYRLLMLELKRERKAVISPDQQRLISALERVQVVDARIVKPSDWWVLKEEV